MDTKNQGIKTVKAYLKDNDYEAICKNYHTLTIIEAKKILDNLMLTNVTSDGQVDIGNINYIITLIKEKVIPTIQYSKVNMGKQKVRQLKNNKSDKVLNESNKAVDFVSQQIKQIGNAYKILGDCYNCIGDITSAINYYTKAERCNVDCSQELNILSDNYPTPNLKAIIAKAKTFKGNSYQEVASAITDYAYSTIDGILQLSIVSLSDDIHDNLRTAFATYLRNEAAGVRENPPMINIAGSFEKMLKEFFYIPYAKYLDDNENNSNIIPTCKRLRDKKIAKSNIPFLKFSNSFTLGNIKPLIVEGFNQDGTYQIDQTFYNFITNYYHINPNDFSTEDLANLVKFIEVFRDSIRNPAGHGVGMHRQTFGYICEELLLKDNSWVKQLVKITNNEYLQIQDLFNHNEPSLISKMTSSKLTLQAPSNINSFVSLHSVARVFNMNKFIIDLQAFISKNNRYPNVNSEKQEEWKLAKTVNIIRLFLRGINKLNLNERDIAMLNEIGFDWEAKIDWFSDFYTSLLQYKNEYGNLDIPTNYVTEDGKQLGTKVMLVRKIYDRKANNYKGSIRLAQNHIEALNNIGFVWNVQNENTKWFDEFYQDVLEYKNTFGSFKDILFDKELGPKVMSFVSAYVKTKNGKATKYKVTREMVLKLKDIGFDLSQTNGNDEEKDFTL